MASIKLGELLVKANVLQESQLRAALAEQKKWGGRLGEILVRMSLVTEDLLTRALSRQLNVQAVNVDAVRAIAPNVKDKIPARLARSLEAVPLQLRDEGRTLVVAMSDPGNLNSVDMLRAQAGCRIVAQLASPSAISRALSRYYDGAEVGEVENSFKLVDAQGEVKDLHESKPELPEIQLSAQDEEADPERLLQQLEALQRKEAAALSAMVELLIQKGVFTRAEYLAKVKR